MHRLFSVKPESHRIAVVNEQGLILPQGGQYGLALCFPGAYSLGMAHLGFQSLFRILSEASGWWGDRFFSDTGSRSLVAHLPLRAFHLAAFSLSFELDVFPFLLMLQQAHIPLFVEKRQEEDPFVLAGGPLVTLNPEIVAPFVDAAVIGEAEVTLPQILTVWAFWKARGATREDVKLALSRIPGVYVPEFYTPVYERDVLRAFEISHEAPFPVYRQWGDLEDFETRTFIYTPLAHFRNTALVELNRGCRYRCRFCAGSCIYAPFRQRSLALVLSMIRKVLEWQPEKVGFVGSDVLGYPAFPEVVHFLRNSGKKLTLSSLVGKDLYGRSDLLELLRAGGLETITLAPETGDVAFRLFLGKGLSNDEWLELILECLRVGFARVKLYFMLGKPEAVSVEADLEFLARLVRLAPSPSRLWVSYSFLIPKPHTFLEDYKAESFERWKREKEIFERGLRKMRIAFSGESPRRAWVELILTRGDRALARCLPELLEGERFLSLPSWRRILSALGRDEREWPRLPWRGGLKPWSVVHLWALGNGEERSHEGFREPEHRTGVGNHCRRL